LIKRYVGTRILLPSAEEGHLEIEAEETLMMPHTLDAACVRSRAVVQAVDLVMAGEMDNAFARFDHRAIMRIRQAGAFCFFNKIASGGFAMQCVSWIGRVAIVDFDVHHG